MKFLPLLLAVGLSGCGALGPLSSILSTPAENIDCTYKRAGLKWEAMCTMNGTIDVEGLDLPMPPVI